MDSVIKFVHVIRETNCLFACHVPYLCFAHLVSCGKMSVSKASPGFSGLKGTGAGVTNPADGERRWGQREGPSGTLRINLSPPKRASSTLLSGFCGVSESRSVLSTKALKSSCTTTLPNQLTLPKSLRRLNTIFRACASVVTELSSALVVATFMKSKSPKIKRYRIKIKI